MLENQKKQIDQLKMYIGDSENVPQPVDIARKEINSLNTQLKVKPLHNSGHVGTDSVHTCLGSRLDPVLFYLSF